ncbi:MAG: sensor domain-containing diguanylate cyclase [Sphaerochaeta sp.]|jgi:diguanylate cyclase (GGDEF)-like protein/PAS domain S-box-containing protein|uniref:sensor domain-containing diguanylate cyclase n=1 Tax=Sphaerochaeta sp. TaxID=1972642 RepID=UPI002FCBD549
MVESQRDVFASTCRTLVEQLPDGVVFCTAEGVLLYANQSFLSLFALHPSNELCHTTLFQFCHPQDAASLNDFMLHLHNEGAERSVLQLKMIGCDQAEYWIELRTVGISTDSGTFLIVRDLTSYKSLQEELLLQALTDELTGLYNRRGFKMMAEQELRHAQRLKTEVILLSIDIDMFKSINDTFGHSEGDRVLRLVAKTLQSTFRTSDISARWGGDEFLVLALDAPSGTVGLLTERFKQALRDASMRNALPLVIEVTIGSSCGNEQADLEHLIQMADHAMYERKRRK